MGFAASSKSVTAAVRTPAKRWSRFFQTKKSIDVLPRGTSKQPGTRTSLTGFTNSVGDLGNDIKG